MCFRWGSIVEQSITVWTILASAPCTNNKTQAMEGNFVKIMTKIQGTILFTHYQCINYIYDNNLFVECSYSFH